MSYRRRTTCRACDEERLQPFLDFSPMPLANAFLRTPADFHAERSYPLTVCLCAGCGLVQTPDLVAPEVLFREYVYVSGTSDTIAAHHRAYAKSVIERVGLVPTDLVVEIASNDGSLLACFRDEGVRVLGVEPAFNVAERARKRGIETVTRFFDAKLAGDLRASHGEARAVVANNVLAHVDRPVDFLRGCAKLLAEDGAVVVEVPYLGDLLLKLEYDTIYHEHLSYFSIGSLLRLFDAAGLAVTSVERVPVHGGSLRVTAAAKVAQVEDSQHDAKAIALGEEEQRSGLASLDRWKRFAEDVAANRTALVQALKDLKKQGAKVAAYGAPAKGNTLLNWCRIGTQLVEYTVDKSPLKVGSFTPGMHLPVLPAKTLLERRPDCVLVLAWNFMDEILEQQREVRELGAKFMRPIPKPEVVT